MNIIYSVEHKILLHNNFAHIFNGNVDILFPTHSQCMDKNLVNVPQKKVIQI